MLNYFLQRRLKTLQKKFPGIEKIYYRINQKGIALKFKQMTLSEKDLKIIRSLNLQVVEICVIDGHIEILVKPMLRVMTYLWIVLVIEVLFFVLLI